MEKRGKGELVIAHELPRLVQRSPVRMTLGAAVIFQEKGA